jgi:pimeloyl-ACP methyl ester carboxylesterase
MPEQVPRSEGKVSVNDSIELWYWDTRGDGPAVTLMHAGTGSAASWGYQQPAFVNQGYRVIAYSRRGHYKSSQGSEEHPGNGAEDLDKLLKHLNLEKVHLVAAAYGGNYAIDYALTHPEKVQSLTVYPP